jgi:hypothetical protein
VISYIFPFDLECIRGFTDRVVEEDDAGFKADISSSQGEARPLLEKNSTEKL